MANREHARKSDRVVYAFGRPRWKREPHPCQTHHEGPFIRRPDMDEWMEAFVAEVGLQPRRMRHYQCQTCGSDIDICNLARVA